MAINRAFGVGHDWNTFLFNWGCLAFLARGVYIGWAGSLVNIYSWMCFSFRLCLYLTLGVFSWVVERRNKTNSSQIPSSLPSSHDVCEAIMILVSSQPQVALYNMMSVLFHVQPHVSMPQYAARPGTYLACLRCLLCAAYRTSLAGQS